MSKRLQMTVVLSADTPAELLKRLADVCNEYGESMTTCGCGTIGGATSSVRWSVQEAADVVITLVAGPATDDRPVYFGPGGSAPSATAAAYRKFPPMAGSQAEELVGKFCRWCGAPGGEMEKVPLTDTREEDRWEHPGCRPGAQDSSQFTLRVLEPGYVCGNNGCYCEAVGTTTDECPECGEHLGKVESVHRYDCKCGGWTWVNAANEHTEREPGTHPVCCPECGAETGVYSPA